MDKTVTLRIPLYVALFLYTVMEHYLSGQISKPPRVVLTEKLRKQLTAIHDELAYQITMELI